MFHSAGTVQSSTGVPVGTSWTSSGISLARSAPASARTPSPVMLRQIGYSSADQGVHLLADRLELQRRLSDAQSLHTFHGASPLAHSSFSVVNSR